MSDNFIRIDNVCGLGIDAYPFRGEIEDAKGKIHNLDGVGMTIYFADVEIDDDGCLFIGMTNQQALQMARYITDVVFTNNNLEDGCK